MSYLFRGELPETVPVAVPPVEKPADTALPNTEDAPKIWTFAELVEQAGLAVEPHLYQLVHGGRNVVSLNHRSEEEQQTDRLEIAQMILQFAIGRVEAHEEKLTLLALRQALTKLETVWERWAQQDSSEYHGIHLMYINNSGQGDTFDLGMVRWALELLVQAIDQID